MSLLIVCEVTLTGLYFSEGDGLAAILYEFAVADAVQSVEPAFEELALLAGGYALEVCLSLFPKVLKQLLLVRVAVDGAQRLGANDAVGGQSHRFLRDGDAVLA